jgi:hypothetical protein
MTTFAAACASRSSNQFAKASRPSGLAYRITLIQWYRCCYHSRLSLSTAFAIRIGPGRLHLAPACDAAFATA